MRAFIAIDVNDINSLNQISRIQRKVLESVADLKPVDPKNMHFTIKFLGEISNTEAEEIIKRFNNLDNNSIEVTYKGIGVFPSLSRISVVWIGVEKEEEGKLIEVSEKVNTLLQGLRFQDNKKFLPHITIFRVKSGRNKQKLIEIIKENENLLLGKDRLTTIKLKQSILTSQGPIYNDIYTHHFKEA